MYLKFERRGDGIDFEKETVDKTTDSFRVGAHAGIGDILSNISARGVNLEIKNLFELYGEFGVKSWSVENDDFNFDENAYEVHFVSAFILVTVMIGKEGFSLMSHQKQNQLSMMTLYVWS